MIDTTGAVESCIPKIQQAHAEGKLLWEPRTQTYASPAEMVRLQRNGQLCWHGDNFKLVEYGGEEYQRGTGYL